MLLGLIMLFVEVRGKPRIILLDDKIANKTKIKHRIITRIISEYNRNRMPQTCLRADDENIAILVNKV